MNSFTQQSRKFRFNMRALEAIPANPPDSKSTNLELSDEKCVSLKLFSSKNGRKTFHLRYRHNGRKRVIRIGEFPSCTIADARKLANNYKLMLAKGDDPLEQRDRIRERSSGANANRHWSVLSKIFSLGMQFQVVEKNPCKTIKKFPESFEGNDIYPGKSCSCF